MHLIAHRGLTSKNIKENTLEAFRNAINNGYEGIELDIRKTKDNKIVVIHDKYINRTSNGSGNINKLLYKELLKYNFGSKKKYSKIPLLKDIVKNINNTNIFIELKEKLNERGGDSILKKKINRDELDSINKKNNTNKYYIMSFNKEYIDNLLGIEYNLGLINYVFNSIIDYNKYNFILVLEDLFNKDIYNYFKEKNIEVILYNLRGNINIKNKDIINEIKYII